ncbi:MAG: T9SS type A sorting domain-containing protein, partial [Bacteroidota bacterium]|nr:T9SS type A sorting domain-containing protein [Bacteroidota bacterium]
YTTIKYMQKPTGVISTTELPKDFILHQNYPNPFNPITKIRFTIHESRFTTLKVYDVLGREVATLVDEVKQPGEYKVEWNAEGLPSGVYIYRLQSGTFFGVKNLILLR